MTKIKNGGLDQYGAGPFEQQQFETAGVERVKVQNRTAEFTFCTDARCNFVVHRRNKFPAEFRDDFGDVNFLLRCFADDGKLHSAEWLGTSTDYHSATTGSCDSWTGRRGRSGRLTNLGQNTISLHVFVLLAEQNKNLTRIRHQ